MQKFTFHSINYMNTYNYNNMFHKIYIFFIIFLIFVCISCDKNRVFEKNIDIKQNIWESSKIIKFNINIEDTLAKHNIYINLRNTPLYQFQNLYLFVTNTIPDGKSFCDTVECILADEKGRWLGTGLGDIINNQILYKKNIRFQQKGQYIVEFEQGMRKKELPGIVDIGLRIEKVK